jgi:hypothetical protein
MRQHVTYHFAILDRNIPLIGMLRREVNIYSQQAVRSLFKVDKLITHACDGFFSQFEQPQNNSPKILNFASHACN